MSITATIDRHRQRFLSDWHEARGLMQFVWLIYLGFLFVPLVEGKSDYRWLWPTLISLPIFILLYFAHVRNKQRAGLWQPIAFAALGLLLVPWNPYGNTYLIFAAAFAPFVLPGLYRPLLFTFALLIPYAIELVLLEDYRYALPITVLVASMSCVGNYLHAENRRKQAELQVSQEEVRRLAQVAERERIGRDLHDLLGHTLSLIALKAELAGKLLTRDANAAAGEIAEMQQIAREALKQVRTAVSGMRSMGLEGELGLARALLESSNVKFSARYKPGTLPPEVEGALAMILREATTNIHRHAQATQAEVELEANDEWITLSVSDDGRGGVLTRGNGLTGVEERTRALGGTFNIDSPPRRGTKLVARFARS